MNILIDMYTYMYQEQYRDVWVGTTTPMTHSAGKHTHTTTTIRRDVRTHLSVHVSSVWNGKLQWNAYGDILLAVAERRAREAGAVDFGDVDGERRRLVTEAAAVRQ